jgi:hypothetical protein
MRIRVAATTLLILGSIGVLPGVAAASPVTAESVIAEAYQQWWNALGARQECASGVSITLGALPARQGEYQVSSRQVVIDPSGDLDTLAGTAIHELSHHAFIACGAFADQDLTGAFFAAQQLPPDRDWFDYSAGWEKAPVEHFAEAMTAAITGDGNNSIAVTPEAVSLVTRWLAAAPIATSPPDGHVPVQYAPAATVAADRRNEDQISGSDESRSLAEDDPEIDKAATQSEIDVNELPQAPLETIRWVNRLRSLIWWPR